VRWSRRGSAPLIRKGFSGTTIPKKNMLPVTRWHSVQWHAYTSSGASPTSQPIAAH
jgi:hypothetical protein